MEKGKINPAEMFKNEKYSEWDDQVSRHPFSGHFSNWIYREFTFLEPKVKHNPTAWVYAQFFICTQPMSDESFPLLVYSAWKCLGWLMLYRACRLSSLTESLSQNLSPSLWWVRSWISSNVTPLYLSFYSIAGQGVQGAGQAPRLVQRRVEEDRALSNVGIECMHVIFDWKMETSRYGRREWGYHNRDYTILNSRKRETSLIHSILLRRYFTLQISKLFWKIIQLVSRSEE